MYLARVIGRLVATARYPGIDGVPLELVVNADLGSQNPEPLEDMVDD